MKDARDREEDRERENGTNGEERKGMLEPTVRTEEHRNG